MEATQTKQKRKYTKVSMDANAITLLLVEKQIKFKDVAELYGVGKGTAKRYMLNPKMLTGYQRLALSKLLNENLADLTAKIDA